LKPILQYTVATYGGTSGETFNIQAGDKTYTSDRYNSTPAFLNDFETLAFASNGKFDGYFGLSITADNISSIEGLHQALANLHESERKIVQSMSNPEPWNGTPEERMYFFNQLSYGMYGSTAASVAAYEFGNWKSATPPTVNYDRVLKVHSVYGDGTKVFEGQSPGKIRGIDPEARGFAHTVLKWDGLAPLRSRIYKARTFGADGIPIKDIDFTAPTFPNGTIRPNHFLPEQHLWLPNPSGGTPIRGKGEPLKLDLSSGKKFRGDQVISN